MNTATIIKCSACGASMTRYPGERVLICRYCGARTAAEALNLARSQAAPGREI